GVVTIVNDDGPPSLSINDVTVTEGNSGTTEAVLTVSLSVASAFPVTVNWTTADGTAMAPSDYLPGSGTLTFAPGLTSQTLTVKVNGDRFIESNETFVVNLSNALNAVITKAQGVVTILNDDTNLAPVVTITKPANNATFYPGSDLTITAEASDSDGTVSQVEFFVGTTPIGAASSKPYTVVWSNVGVGNYLLTARA